VGSERHGAEGVEIGAGGDGCTEEGRGLVAGVGIGEGNVEAGGEGWVGEEVGGSEVSGELDGEV